MSDSEAAIVLIVDDEKDVLEVFRRWLEEEYEVHTATDGAEALAHLEENDVDVVLLDRRMPGLTGDEVLERINELGLDCKVAMVTAVEPDLDIIQMGFDAYVVKPPSYEGLRNTIEDLLERRQYSEHRQEYWSLLSKRAVLESEASATELAQSEEYQELLKRIEMLAIKLGEARDHMGDDVTFLSTIQDIEGG